jgi:hypothetical protein
VGSSLGFFRCGSCADLIGFFRCLGFFRNRFFPVHLRRFFGKVPSPGRKCQPIENIDEFRLTDRSVNQPGQPIENIDESRLTDRSVNQPGQPIENIDEFRLIPRRGPDPAPWS